MKFLAKLWQCLFVWRVLPSPWADVGGAQVILAQSFGFSDERGPGLSNEVLAEVVRQIHERYQLPLVLQWEIADWLFYLPAAGVIRKHRTEGKYLDTHEVLAQSAEFCRRYGWRRVVVVAHPDHVWRVIKVAQKLGLEVVAADTANVPYDGDNRQFWAHSRFWFVPREILARLIYLRRGWL